MAQQQQSSVLLSWNGSVPFESIQPLNPSSSHDLGDHSKIQDFYALDFAGNGDLDVKTAECIGLGHSYNPHDGGKVKVPKIRTEWIGTSQFYIEDNVALQFDGHLDDLIAYRDDLLSSLRATPYDPALYIELARVDSKLSFTDIASSNAHKALILIKAALNLNELGSAPNLASKVIHCTSQRLGTLSIHGIDDELHRLHSQAFSELLYGLTGCACSWEGLLVARVALEIFPSDLDIVESRDCLKKAFQDRHATLKEKGSTDIIDLSRSGRIYQKPYPWLDAALYIRTPALVNQVNQAIGSNICEIRPVVFGALIEDVNHAEPNAGDVGPLGVFAARDIREGEVVMVDKTITGVSDVSSSELKHCDACHGSISSPYLDPSEIMAAKCCDKVAFCGQECHDRAINGYHRVLCGKDLGWVYDAQAQGKLDGSGAGWLAILFLRVIAIVISDMRNQLQHEIGENGNLKFDGHPLKHPLIARMAANYASPLKLHPDYSHTWKYVSNVVAPTRILTELGIDVFSDIRFSPEVIQTIYWRIENNANQSATDLSLYSAQPPERKTPDLGTLRMTSINPNYLFFNHSCSPNISWHSAVPDPWVGISWLEGMNGEVLQPGCSAVKCTASRDIAKGEELKISYVGDPQGKDGEVGGGRQVRRLWLTKWFEGGCGCALCQKENKAVLD